MVAMRRAKFERGKLNKSPSRGRAVQSEPTWKALSPVQVRSPVLKCGFGAKIPEAQAPVKGQAWFHLHGASGHQTCSEDPSTSSRSRGPGGVAGSDLGLLPESLRGCRLRAHHIPRMTISCLVAAPGFAGLARDLLPSPRRGLQS